MKGIQTPGLHGLGWDEVETGVVFESGGTPAICAADPTSLGPFYPPPPQKAGKGLCQAAHTHTQTECNARSVLRL